MMAPRHPSHPKLQQAPSEDTSAKEFLQSLAADRGPLLNDAEYQTIRRSVLEELAHHPSPRTFTVLTFTVVTLVLLGLVAAGITTRRHDQVGGTALALAGLGALGLWMFFLLGYVRGMRREAARSLQERLAELEDLRAHDLVSQDEYTYIRAGILLGRQRSRST